MRYHEPSAEKRTDRDAQPGPGESLIQLAAGDELVITDRDQPTAWVQSDTAVHLEDYR